MAKLTPREAAIMRQALQVEQQALRQGMTNTSDEIGAEYPRMLYRKTDEEDVHVVSTDRNGLPRETMVRNSFGGLLCEVMVADSADEAEALAASGWDVSPQAAHGVEEGLIAATTAKDDEIVALRAQIAAMEAAMTPEQPKRGPGRPPRVPDEQQA